jgi:hypothetical protein
MTTIRTPEFDLAWRFVNETRQSLFLTGKAGTGKTTFLRYLRKHSHKQMVVAAPTGIAAINAGGVTLHSFFQLPLSPYIPAKDERGNAINAPQLLARLRFNRSKLDILRKMELLVIDEASMVAGHTLDAVDTILRSVRRRPNEPFGGVQVLFIGDLHQLQPVVKQDEWLLLKPYYPSAFFFDSEVLRAFPPVSIELKQIFRQRDEQFIALLNEIRHNQLTEPHLRLLNARLRPGFMPGRDDSYVTLTTHNAQADDMNRRMLASIGGKSQTYSADVEGDFPEGMYPADAKLELKVGAQVMFLRNDNEGKKFFNGKIGTVTQLGAEHVWVRCPGEDEEIEVSAAEWPNMAYELNPESKELTENERGVFRQLPLRLAWAITIHKSQGLTFDKLIIDAERAFANGQVYVALSRCTSLDGLVLTSPISQRFLGAHADLRTWQDKQVSEDQLPAELQKAREAFQQQELANAFDLLRWRKAWGSLRKLLTLHQEMLLQPWQEWHSELDKLQMDTEEVARKFQAQLRDLLAVQPNAEQNDALQERVRSAANWFRQRTLQWLEKFQQVPFKVRTLTEAREIQDELVDIHELVHDYQQRFAHLRNGFVLDKFLEETKKAKGPSEPLASVYEKMRKPSGVASSAGSNHPQLMARLRQWRSEMVAPGQPAYTVVSNATLDHLCSVLPGNDAALSMVKGIGARKAAEYGEQLVRIIREYCEENDIEPALATERSPKEKKAKKRKAASAERDGETSVRAPKVDTLALTIDLLNEGKSVEEIAAERSYSRSTIEGHIAKGIEIGLVKLDQLMDEETIRKIESAMTDEGRRLSELKESLDDDISYAQIRWVIAHRTANAR